jgi:glycosyltransferase involved in cell wall biosynthesis
MLECFPLPNTRDPEISIVIPVYNSGSRLLNDLHAALAPVLARLDAELLLVDDGSSAETRDALHELYRRDGRIRVVELATNFGQHAAFSAGFDQARGNFIVTMDADLQADPEEIPRLVAPLRDGYDLVSGVRLNRKDPLLRRMSSLAVTRLVAGTTGVRLRDIGCPFNALSRDVARSVGTFGEMRRFLKPLAVRIAHRVTEVEVTHRARPAQKPRSSYSATGLIRLFMDFFVNSLGDVFAWVFVVSAAVSALMFLTSAIALGVWLVGRAASAVLLGAVGLGVFAGLVGVFALAADYVQRIYRQSSGRPFYLIRRVLERETR